jgi:hypothetical protein
MGLTGIPDDSRKRRGPHPALSDAQLHNRRDQLVQIFEGHWGEIGWELQRCKKPDDVIRVLSPLAESRSWVAEVVEVFCRPSSEPASATILHRLRSQRRGLAEPGRIADASKRRAEEQLHQVNWALTQAHGRSRRIVKRARKQQRKEAWKIEKQYRNVVDAERRLEARLSTLEASFARQELVRFIRSKRYELTPLNLANAAAGLPGVGWRQSMRRNASAPSVAANGLEYQIFKAIRYLAKIADRRTENGLVEGFRESIPLLPSRYRLARVELAEKWLYLERALRQSYRVKSHVKALPFEITKRFFKQSHSPSQVDMVLAQQAKIPLSKHVPVSSS